jgi:hypothetical protein
MKSVLEEIPPFVHQTGDALKDMADRLNSIMIIDKPVVHVTANVLLPIDLDVRIAMGRSWFAYPLPDDYSTDAATRYLFDQRMTRALEPLDPDPIWPLAYAREGYPWLAPTHRGVGSTSGHLGGDNDFTAIGLHWQSLIVSPKQMPWMVPPHVPEDPRFAWWLRLRQVPASYVWNRGESERFLYYDGPTLAKIEATWTWDAKAQALRYSPPDDAVSAMDRASQFRLHPTRSALFVRVGASGVEGKAINEVELNAARDSRPGLIVHPDLSGDAVEEVLRKWIVGGGLNEGEAAGLIDCWKKQFFQTPGVRVIQLISREEYDRFCPMTVRPAPTEMARVGLILTEFQALSEDSN